jgi:hypothetical protein
VPTYFKPLRRTIGVLSLGLACVFAAGWVRSLSFDDDIRLPNSLRTTYFIGSADGRLLCSRWSDLTAKDISVGGWKYHSEPRDTMSPEDRFRQNENPIIFEWCGFCSALFKSTKSPRRFQIWLIPYWSIVIPLTLLSAWLLISKPRVKKIESNMAKPATDSLS